MTKILHYIDFIFTVPIYTLIVHLCRDAIKWFETSKYLKLNVLYHPCLKQFIISPGAKCYRLEIRCITHHTDVRPRSLKSLLKYLMYFTIYIAHTVYIIKVSIVGKPSALLVSSTLRSNIAHSS